MDRAEELASAIAGLQREIKDRIAERGRWLNEWAALVSPWKVGDVCKGQGYSFNKQDCRIVSVTGRLAYDTTPQVRIFAKVLKKDGSDSERTTDWTWRPE